MSLRPAGNIETVNEVMASNAALNQLQYIRAGRHRVLRQTYRDQIHSAYVYCNDILVSINHFSRSSYITVLVH